MVGQPDIQRSVQLDLQWNQLPAKRNGIAREYADAGSWLVISAAAGPDVVADKLCDALKGRGALCTSMSWPNQADDSLTCEQLGNHLRAGRFTGVVIVTAPNDGDHAEQSPVLGREYVRHLVHITRELPEIRGELPRLFVITRNAQTVLAGDVANLEQAELRGLIRVIGHLLATLKTLRALTGGVEVVADKTSSVPAVVASVNANLKPVSDFAESI